MHYTPYILEYVSYTWFQWCWYFDKSTKSKRLCCWLVPTHQVGQAFKSKIILDSAQHIARSSVIGIRQDEILSNHMKEETNNFMTSLESLTVNDREGVFQPTSSSIIYYDDFGMSSSTGENVLPYGDGLVDAKSETGD